MNNRAKLDQMISNGQLEDLLSVGITEKQIYTSLGITKKQWETWKKEDITLKDLVDRCFKDCSLEGQAILAKKAKGYFYTEEHQEIPIDVNTGKPIGEGKLIKVKKWCPPDEEALNKLMSIQLLNKMREEEDD